MKRVLCVLLIFLLLSPAYTEEKVVAEPYSEEEFPEALHSLRRAEIVSLGSVPFIMFTLSISFMIVKGFTLSKETGKTFTFGATANEREQLILLSSALGLGVCVGITDYIISRHKAKIRKAELKAKREREAQGIKITAKEEEEKKEKEAKESENEVTVEAGEAEKQ